MLHPTIPGTIRGCQRFIYILPSTYVLFSHIGSHQSCDLHDNLDVGMATATGAVGIGSITANNIGEASESNKPTPPLADGSTSCSVEGTEVVELVILNDLNGDMNKKDIPSNNQFDTLELIDECEEKDRNYSNAESSSSLLSSNNDSRSADFMHNSATLAIGDSRRLRRRNSYNNSKKNSCANLDSIDHIKDNDAVDAVKIHSTADEPRLDTFRQKKKKSKKKSHSESADEEEVENRTQVNEKLVTCMYYSLVCWDCSIS
ncbi:uncharacterized protein LOC131438292 isoform X2 [Malaya genurostris]|uniref:uncharacterized protein LOC131438292 isoform X2 n=1 Tax=Malaya genurostris TaxID=325434 RepID=UPI0026F3E065|nr:uncharacterized protein LOC131438292 isoform X2 [Malaya genurostris]